MKKKSCVHDGFVNSGGRKAYRLPCQVGGIKRERERVAGDGFEYVKLSPVVVFFCACFSILLYDVASVEEWRVR